jgi:phosphotransferase system HPr-like phosphotransfer protein
MKRIRLDTVQKVKDFTSIASKYPFTIDIKSKNYIVDAKSILGIFSLDLGNLLEVRAYATEEDKSNFIKEIVIFED